ncbi:hypothetical protein DAEQUDRAFT_452672 [Daedalea quercina L-15889]|uniref:Uncharacterized protein n=1 Tax=Daedalea quercina L-15889 TaxID=1314783 RepID=A0A165N4N6_9APHY|nr:hypothetical protein DAEQUDRAFT_452672 [Daedalea quercina L-15889]
MHSCHLKAASVIVWSLQERPWFRLMRNASRMSVCSLALSVRLEVHCHSVPITEGALLVHAAATAVTLHAAGPVVKAVLGCVSRRMID